MPERSNLKETNWWDTLPDNQPAVRARMATGNSNHHWIYSCLMPVLCCTQVTTPTTSVVWPSTVDQQIDSNTLEQPSWWIKSICQYHTICCTQTSACFIHSFTYHVKENNHQALAHATSMPHVKAS